MDNASAKKVKPNPGSPEAIDQGCTCPVDDNARGRGFPMTDGEMCFYVEAACPLHGVPSENNPRIVPLLEFEKEVGPVAVLSFNGQQEGALPNGARVSKTNSEPGDGHQDGARGTILGSVADPDNADPEIAKQIGYFVEWDDRPGLPVAIASHRISPIVEEES